MQKLLLQLWTSFTLVHVLHGILLTMVSTPP